jgi:glyoxylase I family protein
MYPYHHVSIFSSDYERSEEFYAHFGFKRLQTMKLKSRDGEIVMLGNGSAHIELFPAGEPDTVKRNPDAPGFRHICFKSDDVQADYERLRDKLEFTKPPHGNERQLITFLRDPDGVEVELFQKLQPE